jgi:ribitol-5-phosphate 2-dehydrogenase (NADP+)
LLSKGFKVISPKTFEVDIDTINNCDDHAIVKIEYAAVCKADLRYYLGNRDKRVLGMKYPMRLIHEATGEVLRDNTGRFNVGDKVVLVPNICKCDECDFGVCDNPKLGPNYCPNAKFASSNYDGFSCECISYPSDNLVKCDIEKYKNTTVFAELISVCIAAIRRLTDLENKVIGVWGDGLLGYLLSHTIKVMHPNSKVFSIGNNENKLRNFSVDGVYLFNSDEIGKNKFDIAFECVGGDSAASAINQMIECVKFGGEIVLTGVSENGALLNTRRILEKAVTITGSTRSTVNDFEVAVNLMENTKLANDLEKLVLSTNDVKNISDYYGIFERESKSRELGKHIMKYNL